MRPLTRLAVVSIAVLGASATTAVRAADLQFIMLADTLDANIGTDVDLASASDWIHTVADNTGLSLRSHTLSGNKLTVTGTRQMLQSLDPGQDDVICFIYSGHGANGGDSDYPYFTLLTGGAISFDEVFATLDAKPHRMLLVMADCCNVLVNGSGRGKPPAEPAGQSALTAANYQRLFLNFSGSVAAIAAAKGQYSLGDSNLGGVFLSTFMEDIAGLTANTESLTWDTVLSQTSKDVTDLVTEYILTDPGLNGIDPQEPQYEINIEQVAGETPPDPTDTTGTADTTDTTNQQSTADTGQTDTTDTTDNADADTTSENPAPACGPMGMLPLTLCACCWLAATRRRHNRNGAFSR